jgi:protein O-GlcNAc transferase
MAPLWEEFPHAPPVPSVEDAQILSATAHQRQRVALAPADLTALAGLGEIHFVDRNSVAAGVWLSRAAVLAPEDPVVLLNDAAARLALGSTDRAGRAARRAIALAPALTTAATLLAESLARGASGEADLWLTRALGGTKEAADIWRRRAGLARDRHKLGHARAYGRMALLLSPADPNQPCDLARTMTSLGSAADAISLLHRARALAPRSDILNQLVLAMSYEDLPTPVWSVETCRRPDRRPPRAPSPYRNSIDRERRLRVGYVSTDFRDHPVGHALSALLPAHDPAKVEIACYASTSQDDALTTEIRRTAARWRPCAGLGDRQVAALMREDLVDVAVHLASRFANNRPLLPVFRPAPIQIAMHDLTTTGLVEIDAWLTDPVLHPTDTQEAFVEPLWRLPHFYAFARPPDIARAPPPHQASGFITFGSANNPAKLTGSVIGAWAEVLRAVPNSRLWLKFFSRTGDDGVRQSLLTRFAQARIDPDRIVFAEGAVDRNSHLRSLGTVDIALDPFPFNGANTTFEALWMGVPAVTLSGDRFVGRVAESLLREVGLPDLVAKDRQAYIATAARLAADRQRLALLRNELRDRVVRSRLLDVAGLARSLEVTYRSLWHRWCLKAAETKA